jgi:hypothetical protein
LPLPLAPAAPVKPIYGVPPPRPSYIPAPVRPSYVEPDYTSPVSYSYQYGVNDALSGVNLGHSEARDGTNFLKSQNFIR